MKIEFMTLLRFIDNFFDPEDYGSWRYYDRPVLDPQQAKEVAQWYPVGIPTLSHCIGMQMYDAGSGPESHTAGQ